MSHHEVFSFFFFNFFCLLKIPPPTSINQHHHTETHNRTCTQTEDNLISRAFMDEGVESEVQWPAGSQRQKYREKNRGRIGVKIEWGRAIIPTVPGKTLHLSIICGFLLGAITGWLTTITTHLCGRENRCLDKPHSYHTPVIFVM